MRAIHCTFIAMGLKIFIICLKIDVVWLFRKVKRQLRIVLCKESPYSLIDVLGPFSVTLQPWNFYQVKFTDTSSAGKTARKITKILRSFELESFKSVQYAWCYEFLKVGTFFWLTPSRFRTTDFSMNEILSWIFYLNWGILSFRSFSSNNTCILPSDYILATCVQGSYFFNKHGSTSFAPDHISPRCVLWLSCVHLVEDYWYCRRLELVILRCNDCLLCLVFRACDPSVFDVLAGD